MGSAVQAPSRQSLRQSLFGPASHAPRAQRSTPSHISLPRLPPYERSPCSTRHRTAQRPSLQAPFKPTHVKTRPGSTHVKTRTHGRALNVRYLTRSTCTSTCTPHTTPRTPTTRRALSLTPTPAQPYCCSDGPAWRCVWTWSRRRVRGLQSAAELGPTARSAPASRTQSRLREHGGRRTYRHGLMSR